MHLVDAPGKIFEQFSLAAIFLGKHLLHHEKNLRTLYLIIIHFFVEILRQAQ
jgi:hypothetical protein